MKSKKKQDQELEPDRCQACHLHEADHTEDNLRQLERDFHAFVPSVLTSAHDRTARSGTGRR